MATGRSCAAEAAASSIETAKHANIRERRMEPPGSSNSTVGCRQQQNCCLRKQLSGAPHLPAFGRCGPFFRLSCSSWVEQGFSPALREPYKICHPERSVRKPEATERAAEG